MAPKSPWKTNTPKNNKKNDGQFASTKQANVAGLHVNQIDEPGSVNYAEVQSDEIEVLKAIYMEDYEEVEVKSAWSTTSDKAFRLTLRSFSDEETYVVLSVKLTATYPRSPPVLQVKGLEKLHTTARNQVQKIIQSRPGELSGEAMIHAIATDIQDVLEDAVLSRERGVLPSLEEERMIQENVAEQQAKELEADEAKRAEAVQAEEDRMMDQMVQQEIERRDKHRSKARRTSEAEKGNANADDIRFDQTISLTRADLIDFSTVSLVSSISSKGSAKISAAKPKVIGHTTLETELLAVRQVRLNLPPGESSSWSELLELEEILEQLKGMRQANIVNLYAFKIEKIENEVGLESQNRVVTVLTDLANRGSLAEMLEDGQTVPLPKARQWSLDLLEALDFYHRNGMIHKRIHPGNVLFFRSQSGVTMPKLADAGYEDRLLRLQGRSSTGEKAKKMVAWLAPEVAVDHTTHTRRSDIWDFGVLLIQMLFGTTITRKHASPHTLLESLDLSESLEAVLLKVFSKDARERPTAFDLMPSEFFRSDGPLTSAERSHSSRHRRLSSSQGFSGQRSPIARRSRQNSASATEAPSVSRYLNDFVELGRLGKGGFGEVVKARNKADGGVYAIKKIKQTSVEQLQQVLSEAMLLHRLNNAYVVRYFSAWVEDDFSSTSAIEEDSVTESYGTSTGQDIEFGLSSRGLDFASSQGYNIEFGEDSSEDDGSSAEDDEDDEDEDVSSGTETGGHQTHMQAGARGPISERAIHDSHTTDSSPLMKTRSKSHRIARSVLYIQMEYCERHTLRDIIRRDIYEKPQEGWQMLRQVVEGLAHIHSHGIIHRDLKPDNIFIDITGIPRIGDFGLATTSRQLGTDKILASTNTGEDMTRSIGTALYVAPEISSGTGSYNDKVDMYSLGIIFFEMCYPLKTAMERHQVILQIREKVHVLPPAFANSEKSKQADVIMSLINHTPSERPSSHELLRSGKLPVPLEDETILQIIDSLEDTRSYYYQKVMASLFTPSRVQRARALAWEAGVKEHIATEEEMGIRDDAHQLIHSLLRHHGAQEMNRSVIHDRSNDYAASDVFQLLDASGNLLQLAYDYTLPYARQLAKHPPVLPVQKSFVFGRVYRDVLTGGPPKALGIIDFDIASRYPRQLALHEAECMKAVENIIDNIPALSALTTLFHLNHSDLLELILDHCRIDKAQRTAVKEILSKLNFHRYTWKKIRAELRAPLLAIPSTSLDELQKFDFRETWDKTQERLLSIFLKPTYANRLRRPLEQIRNTIEYMKVLGVRKKVFVSPLSCINEKYYAHGLMFQCVNDKKNQALILAAGGRYDSLIEAHRARGQPTAGTCHAVGVSIGWDSIVNCILRHRKNTSTSTYLKKGAEEISPAHDALRCEILIASSDQNVLDTVGARLLPTLWGAKFSAELAIDTGVVDDLLGRRLDTSHTWVIIVKHDPSVVKVWSSFYGTMTEVSSQRLLQSLHAEQKEREHEASAKLTKQATLVRHHSHNAADDENQGESQVRVLLAQHKSKKSNKYNIINKARERWHALLKELQSGPILAIETRDETLEAIQQTKLSDVDSWKKVIQTAPVSDRQYLSQVQEELLDIKAKWTKSDSPQVAGLYNFRSGACIYYDLGI
ncbi:hypothetical protein AAFC00_003423 [Neodothiora populina]|uniref:non-specific serine/threonine protein kinase n=1 Tax=Neodothiora populina TaxID=2781224 RepID=A0ABR3PE40_9PEZI